MTRHTEAVTQNHGEDVCGYPKIFRFKCAGCKRLVHFCQGASDDYPDLCDECAVTESS